MTRSEVIMNQYRFSETTKALVNSKLTEKGKIKALSTREAFTEAFRSREAVFQRVFNERRLKSQDTCSCGKKISRSYRRMKGRSKTWKYRCLCRHVTSPLKGTPFENCKRPFNHLLMLIHEMYNSKHGYTAQQFSRDYHYKRDTAHSKVLKVLTGMGVVIHNTDFTNSPESIYEADAVYPPVPSGLPKQVPISRGLGSEKRGRVHVVAERNGLVIPNVVENVDKLSIESHFDKIPPGSFVFTDEAKVYRFLKQKYQHDHVNHLKKEFAKIGIEGKSVHVNVTESYNLKSKNEVANIHRGVSRQHLQKYADGQAFIFTFRHKDIYQAIDAFFDKCCPPLFETSNNHDNSF